MGLLGSRQKGKTSNSTNLFPISLTLLHSSGITNYQLTIIKNKHKLCNQKEQTKGTVKNKGDQKKIFTQGASVSGQYT